MRPGQSQAADKNGAGTQWILFKGHEYRKPGHKGHRTKQGCGRGSFAVAGRQLDDQQMSGINSKTSPCLQSELLVQCISAAACNNKAAASVSRVGTTLAKCKAWQQVRPMIERYSYKSSSFCEIHDFLSCMITSQR